MSTEALKRVRSSVKHKCENLLTEVLEQQGVTERVPFHVFCDIDSEVIPEEFSDG